MSVTTGEQDLLELLRSLTPGEIRSAGIAAACELRARRAISFDPRKFGPAFLASAVQLKPGYTTERAMAMEAVWGHCLSSVRPEMLKISSFLWWLVRAGLAVPTPPFEHVPAVTLIGDSAWEAIARGAPHPLAPTAVQRVLDRCKGQLPDEVVDLLTDSAECMSHGLNRAAIALLGVAYEAVVEIVLESLHANQLTGPLPAKAWQRIAALRAAIPQVLQGSDASAKESRGKAERACELADTIRSRRNDAAHTKQALGFEDHDEIEELLVSGFRRLPDLWAMKR